MILMNLPITTNNEIEVSRLNSAQLKRLCTKIKRELKEFIEMKCGSNVCDISIESKSYVNKNHIRHKAEMIITVMCHKDASDLSAIYKSVMRYRNSLNFDIKVDTIIRTPPELNAA